jgi:ATP-dependent Clp protease ATP-binding subunit ClpC
MFERYTERARRVIFFARYEATEAGYQQIETGHFLVGLVREDKSLFCKVREKESQAPVAANIRQAVEEKLPRLGRKESASIELPLSPECKQILQFATNEAEKLNHRHIGTEHLLLAILELKDCLAARILNQQGVTREKVFETLKLAAATKVDPPSHPLKLTSDYWELADLMLERSSREELEETREKLRELLAKVEGLLNST